MKCKLIALVLAVTISTWAQTTNSQQPPAEKTAPTAETKGSCCDKMASKTSTASSEHAQHCMHARASSKDAKGAASCCSGKDAASCCKGKDGKACAKTESASAGCCGESCLSAKDCCTQKDSKKSAHDCCGADQCTHEHHEQPTPGS